MTMATCGIGAPGGGKELPRDFGDTALATARSPVMQALCQCARNPPP